MMKKMMVLILPAVFVVLCLLAGCGEKTFEVDYCGEKLMYDGAKDSYAPGTAVTLRYTLIAADTDYAFYLDGEKLYERNLEKMALPAALLLHAARCTSGNEPGRAYPL